MLAPEILSITSVSTSPTSVEMYCLKGLGLFIAILANLANCQTDDSYSEGSGSDNDDYYYGNTGCRVFKCGVQN